MTSSPTVEVATPDEYSIQVRRSFDAPIALVAEAFTRPELLQRWMGLFDGWAWVVCEIDLRPGGAYRYVWRMPDGTELALSGVYREVSPPDRFVFTQVYENTPEFPSEMLVTLVLTETGGRTTSEMTVAYATQEERDRDLQSMPGGMEAGYAQLDTVLASRGSSF